MLIVAQPVAMLCHAIGGVLLALLVGGAALGREIDRLPAGSWRPSRWRPLARELDWKAIAKRLFVTCWPLLTTVLVVVLWKTFSPEPVASMNRWRWDQKAWSFVLTLRDQSLVLDAATTIACFGLILCGWLAGARWSWRQGLPGLLVLLLFVAIPSDINGSAFVDIRLLPVAAMLLLALQDWSRAKPSYARAVAYIGMALLGLRWWSPGPASRLCAGLPRQLAALHHVEPGSRVLAFVEHTCLEESWRNTRRDHLASLASLYRQAWVNDNWAVPGLHMVVPRFRPGRFHRRSVRIRVVAQLPERPPAQRGFRAQVRADRAGGLCLADRHRPAAPPDPRLQLVWQDGRSLLLPSDPWVFRTGSLGTSDTARPALSGPPSVGAFACQRKATSVSPNARRCSTTTRSGPAKSRSSPASPWRRSAISAWPIRRAWPCPCGHRGRSATAYDYTAKGNLVAVISNGTAIWAWAIWARWPRSR
jgi:hypothetical protein